MGLWDQSELYPYFEGEQFGCTDMHSLFISIDSLSQQRTHLAVRVHMLNDEGGEMKAYIHTYKLAWCYWQYGHVKIQTMQS